MGQKHPNLTCTHTKTQLFFFFLLWTVSLSPQKAYKGSMHHSFLILAPTEQLETSPYMHTNTHTDNFIHHISKLQWCTLASTTAPTPTHPPSPVFLSLPKGLPELHQPVIKSMTVQATLSDILGATTYSHSTPGTGCTRQQQSRGS